MKKLTKISIVLLLVVFQASYLFPGGKHVASYLRMKVDARALAMGGAFTATADGIESIYYNPAGLMYSTGIEVGSMFSSNMAFDRSYNFVGISAKLNTKTKQAIGLAGITAKLDGIPRYTSFNPDVSSGEFSVGETSVMISYAGFDSRVNSYWGATLKLFNSSVDNSSETGMGVDFGVMLNPMDKMKLGIMVRDIYSKIGSEQISPSINVGLMMASNMNPNNNGFIASIESGYIFDGESDVQYSLGVEYSMNHNQDITFSPRCGINNNLITAGFGLRLKLFQIDYAYLQKSNNYFNDSQRVSITLKF